MEQFRRTALLERFAILAYCLMPDHVHLLVEGLTDTSDLTRFAKMAKQRSGGIYRRRFGKRLWQEGYFERVLRVATTQLRSRDTFSRIRCARVSRITSTSDQTCDVTAGLKSKTRPTTDNLQSSTID